MTGKLKSLAILMPAFYEQVIGGAEYQSYLLAEEAKLNGFEVHYIFVSENKIYPNHLQLILHLIKPLSISKKFGAIWSFYCKLVYRSLKSIQPDVIYVRGGWSFAGMAAYYAKKHGCKSIWHVASSEDVKPAKFFLQLKRPFDFIERKAIDYAIRNATVVVAQAKYQADLLKMHYGRYSEVIPSAHPVPDDLFQKINPIKIVWVGNLKPLKQPEMFIKLASEFISNSNVKFIMIGRPGQGNYQKRLESKMKDLSNLEYIGEQPIQEVNRILSFSHIFVNTSRYEGFPNTFIQAWMREVPVISLLLDPDDILKKEKLGFCSSSFEKMIRDVKSLIEDSILREKMGKDARIYAMKNYNAKTNLERLLKLVFQD